MDEPLSGLDPVQLNEVRNLIKELSKNKIILFSSHILQEIDLLCDKIIIINKGEIILNKYKSKLKKPLVAICLGFQYLFSHTTEDGLNNTSTYNSFLLN